MAILSLVLPYLRLMTSCIGCGTPGGSVFPPCVVTIQCSLLCSVFTFHPCLRIWWFGICSAPSDSLQRSVCYVPLIGTYLRCWHILSHLPLSLCLRLPSALSRCSPCFCWLLPLPRELVSCRLYLPLSPLWLGMPACLTSRSLSPSRSRSPVPSLAPSWWRP